MGVNAVGAGQPCHHLLVLLFHDADGSTLAVYLK